jgi:hypothetical protein
MCVSPKFDGFVRSRHSGENRSPNFLYAFETLDSGFRRNEGKTNYQTFYEIIKFAFFILQFAIFNESKRLFSTLRPETWILKPSSP